MNSLNKIISLLKKAKAKPVSKLIQNRFIAIFLFAICILFLYCIYIFIQTYFNIKFLQHISILIPTHIMFGRAASLSLGFSQEMKISTLLINIYIIETLMVLLFFSIFVLSIQNIIFFSWIKKFSEMIRKKAMKYKTLIKKYGIVGLLIFVLIPFWGSGPIVGCVIGYLMHMHPYKVLIIVLSGTYLAIGSWCYILFFLNDKISYYSAYTPYYIAGIILSVIILIKIYDLIKFLIKKKKDKNSASSIK